MPAYDDDRYAPAAPVAKVRLQHPDSGESIAEIPMLIDTGADATLLPKSSIASLGLTGTGERYGLVAFDGTTNESEAVQAVLVFLNKAFRGRFLQVESEVGVIGRNVLNHVRLLLDGPALNWDEWPSTTGAPNEAIQRTGLRRPAGRGRQAEACSSTRREWPLLRRADR
jgi:predicted aspartyl protease